MLIEIQTKVHIFFHILQGTFHFQNNLYSTIKKQLDFLLNDLVIEQMILTYHRHIFLFAHSLNSKVIAIA